jgi:hypothetical protein
LTTTIPETTFFSLFPYDNMDDTNSDNNLVVAAGVDCSLLFACLSANESSELYPFRNELFFDGDVHSDSFRKARLYFSDLLMRWGLEQILNNTILVEMTKLENLPKKEVRKVIVMSYPMLMTDMGPIRIQRDHTSSLRTQGSHEKEVYDTFVDTLIESGRVIQVDKKAVIERPKKPYPNDPVFCFSDSQLNRASFRSTVGALKEINYDEFAKLRDSTILGPRQSRLLLTEIVRSSVYDGKAELPAKLMIALIARKNTPSLHQTWELLLSQTILFSFTMVETESIERIRQSNETRDLSIPYFLTPFGAIRIFEHTLGYFYDNFIRVLENRGRHLKFGKEEYIKFQESLVS